MLMATKHQLRALLEQSCQMAEELTSDALKLVADVQAIHYWMTYSLETFRQLNNIGCNLRKLLHDTEEQLGSLDALLADPAGAKLARTIYGLWRALPGLSGKYTEQLSRRRRQRIMGIEPEDVGQVPPEQIDAELAELNKLREQVSGLYAELKLLAGRIPAELVVEFETEGSGQESAPEAPVREPGPAAPAALAADEAAVAEPDEMSPV
jgi:hypothetical protein